MPPSTLLCHASPALIVVSLALAGTLVKTFKKAIDERINESTGSATHESTGSATQPAPQPEHAMQPVGTPLPLVWATPYLPVALGQTYAVAEAVPMHGSF